MKKIITKMMSIIIAVAILVSSNNIAFASNQIESIRKYVEDSNEFEEFLSNNNNITTFSNNLAWKGEVGDVIIVIEKFHNNHPFPRRSQKFSGQYINHANFIVYKKRQNKKNKEIANYHIVLYKSGNSKCIYVYDSTKSNVIVDRCGNWRDAAKSVVESAKAVAKTVSENGNWIVKAAIWGTALAVLIDLIVPMDPIPILPFSLEEEK